MMTRGTPISGKAPHQPCGLGLSHALECLRAGTGARSGTLETVDSLSAVNLQPNKSEDWHNLLHEARLEDCEVKVQTLEANLFIGCGGENVKRMMCYRKYGEIESR